MNYRLLIAGVLIFCVSCVGGTTVKSPNQENRNVQINQVESASRSFKDRFQRYIRFYEACTNRKIIGELGFIITPDTDLGASYISGRGSYSDRRNNGTIRYTYGSIHVNSSSKASLSLELAFTTHEAEHHDEWVGEKYYLGQRFSPNQKMGMEGRAVFVEIKCMEQGNEEDREYARRRHTALMESYEKYVKPAVEKCKNSFFGMFCHLGSIANKFPYNHADFFGIDEYDAAHILGYVAIRNYVERSRTDWRKAIESSRRIELNPLR